MLDANHLEVFGQSALQDRLLGMRAVARPQCKRCGSSNGRWQGYRINKTDVVRKRQCGECCRWFVGTRYVPRVDCEEAPRLYARIEERLRKDAATQT